MIGAHICSLRSALLEVLVPSQLDKAEVAGGAPGVVTSNPGSRAPGQAGAVCPPAIGGLGPPCSDLFGDRLGPVLDSRARVASITGSRGRGVMSNLAEAGQPRLDYGSGSDDRESVSTSCRRNDGCPSRLTQSNIYTNLAVSLAVKPDRTRS